MLGIVDVIADGGPMSDGLHYILHLTAHSLRWMTLEGGPAPARVREFSTLEGEPAQCLAQWSDLHESAPGRTYLFDGRPRYYATRLALPVKARRQKNRALALRVRQELGLDENEVCWSTIEATSGSSQMTS